MVENMVTADQQLEMNRCRMKTLLMELTTGEGLCPTLLDGVKLARTDHNIPRTPVLYEPSIYVVASGRKNGFVGDREFTYDPNNYLVLSVPLPFEVTTDVGRGEPMLGVSVRVEMSLISELAEKLERRRDDEPENALGIIRPTPLDLPMSAAVVRLLECLLSPVEAEILGPGVVREIVFRVLSGPQGEALRALINRNGHLAKIYATLQWIHREYPEPLNVPRMAEEACMSVSAFHHTFKEVTGTSPLQYVKAVRLHKARLHIKYDGLGASVASAKVGYESPSQFSREFKRFFGHSPARESVRREAMIGADGPEEAFNNARG
jgi:AraC-like DNA-binding protein